MHSSSTTFSVSVAYRAMVTGLTAYLDSGDT